MSKSTVSRVARAIQEEFDAWRKRDLSKDPVLYLLIGDMSSALTTGTHY